MNIRMEKQTTIHELANVFQLHPTLIIDSNPNLKLSEGSVAERTELSIPLTGILNNENNIAKLMKMKMFSVHGPTCHDKIQHTVQRYDSTELYREIEKMVTMFPFIKKEIIGYSVLGKPIIELTIGNGPKKVHMNGSFHANEWITTSVMMHWLKHYLLGLVTNQSDVGDYYMDLYFKTSLSFVPMVNPDGVDLVLNGLPEGEFYQNMVLKINKQNKDFSQWKANIRGVDLNNQYPAHWEIEKKRKIPKAPAPRDYPGDKPLTEPEAITLAKLVENRRFDRVLAFHTQGEEIYWGYLGKEPKEAGIIVEEFEKISGYKAIRNIDSHAGFRDWFVNEFEKPGFTIELGYGVNPLPFEEFQSIYKKSNQIFLAALYM